MKMNHYEAEGIRTVNEINQELRKGHWRLRLAGWLVARWKQFQAYWIRTGC